MTLLLIGLIAGLGGFIISVIGQTLKVPFPIILILSILFGYNVPSIFNL